MSTTDTSYIQGLFEGFQRSTMDSLQEINLRLKKQDETLALLLSKAESNKTNIDHLLKMYWLILGGFVSGFVGFFFFWGQKFMDTR